MRINEENVRRAIDRGLSQLSMTEERKRVILAQCRPSVRNLRPVKWHTMTA